jgi:hypothetical protein
MIVKIDNIDNGRSYNVSYGHSDDFVDQLKNTGALVQREFEHASRFGKPNHRESAKRCKQAIEGIVVIENSATGSVDVLATNPESERALLYKHAGGFLKSHKAMVYQRSYEQPFYVSVPDGNSGIVTRLEEQEFNSYMGLITRHMVDLMETYKFKPSPRNQSAVLSSAQALRNFFWGYYVDFDMLNGQIPDQDPAESIIRYAKFDLSVARGLVRSMIIQDKDVMIQEWIRKNFIVPQMADLAKQPETT